MVHAGMRRFIGLATPSLSDPRDRPTVKAKVLPVIAKLMFPNALTELGTSGWAWTPNNGQWTQPYHRENISSSATFNVHVGCGGTPSSWKYVTTSVNPQSGTADWVCIPGYASGVWNRCSPS